MAVIQYLMTATVLMFPYFIRFGIQASSLQPAVRLAAENNITTVTS